MASPRSRYHWGNRSKRRILGLRKTAGPETGSLFKIDPLQSVLRRFRNFAPKSQFLMGFLTKKGVTFEICGKGAEKCGRAYLPLRGALLGSFGSRFHFFLTLEWLQADAGVARGSGMEPEHQLTTGYYFACKPKTTRLGTPISPITGENSLLTRVPVGHTRKKNTCFSCLKVPTFHGNDGSKNFDVKFPTKMKEIR